MSTADAENRQQRRSEAWDAAWEIFAPGREFDPDEPAAWIFRELIVGARQPISRQEELVLAAFDRNAPEGERERLAAKERVVAG